MKNTIFKGTALGALILSGVLGASAAALADGGMRNYEVTIRNATLGQPITPSLFVTHNSEFSMFEVGDTATPGLATMAETGNPGVLVTEVESSDGVDDTVILATDLMPDPVLLPGLSNTTTISASGNTEFFSAVAMLAATNDAFYAVRGVRLPNSGSVTVRGAAYDAGSEENTELDTDIPAIGAPPMNVHVDPGEGFIHVHAGVHGGFDLIPAQHDWRNPVVEITITRIKNSGS